MALKLEKQKLEEAYIDAAKNQNRLNEIEEWNELDVEDLNEL